MVERLCQQLVTWSWKKKNFKLKIDLLNKIFPLICNTQIPNNLQILCLTSINCLFFLFSNSGNRIISKLFTFDKKQLQENEAIQLTIIILSLNNRKSWKCFNSRLPNTPPKFSVQRNTTCYNVVATSCRTVVTFLSSSDKREEPVTHFLFLFWIFGTAQFHFLALETWNSSKETASAGMKARHK